MIDQEIYKILQTEKQPYIIKTIRKYLRIRQTLRAEIKAGNTAVIDEYMATNDNLRAIIKSYRL
jgi:hypothetical protein